MKSLLVGNGINIQYGSSRCSNKEIVKRVITSPDDPDFPLDAITLTDRHQAVWLIGSLYSEIPNIIRGDFDKYYLASFEETALASFKERYSTFEQQPSPLNVGLEDYFFVLELFFKKNNVRNPDAHAIRETFKRIFSYSIYDSGYLESLHLRYPRRLKSFLDPFDEIFTTNYDSNLDVFSERSVVHLHGCFKTLSYLYDENSFRNQLGDNQLDAAFFDPEKAYLFSNVIFSYSGSLKEFQMKQATRTNAALEKFVDGYKNRADVRKEVAAWQEDESRIMRNLASSIAKKAANPSLKFEEYYGAERLQSISDTLAIVGLSPNNDTHIFDFLKSNDKLRYITYYYHSRGDIDSVRKLLPKDGLSFVDVRSLWGKYE